MIDSTLTPAGPFLLASREIKALRLYDVSSAGYGMALPAAAATNAAHAAAAFWFQPWTLVTNTTVNDAVPTASPLDSPVVLSEGQFVSQEHETSGTAKLLRLSDGSNVVRLENLSTSEGPEVKVLLTDAPVVATSEGYRVFEDGRHVDLGALRGNIGNANYAVPADADINGLDSVSIWCDRFDVSFGAPRS